MGPNDDDDDDDDGGGGGGGDGDGDGGDDGILRQRHSKTMANWRIHPQNSTYTTTFVGSKLIQFTNFCCAGLLTLPSCRVNACCRSDYTMQSTPIPSNWKVELQQLSECCHPTNPPFQLAR